MDQTQAGKEATQFCSDFTSSEHKVCSLTRAALPRTYHTIQIAITHGMSIVGCDEIHALHDYWLELIHQAFSRQLSAILVLVANFVMLQVHGPVIFRLRVTIEPRAFIEPRFWPVMAFRGCLKFHTAA
jgi:hypothetical protein